MEQTAFVTGNGIFCPPHTRVFESDKLPADLNHYGHCHRVTQEVHSDTTVVTFHYQLPIFSDAVYTRNGIAIGGMLTLIRELLATGKVSPIYNLATTSCHGYLVEYRANSSPPALDITHIPSGEHFCAVETVADIQEAAATDTSATIRIRVFGVVYDIVEHTNTLFFDPPTPSYRLQLVKPGSPDTSKTELSAIAAALKQRQWVQDSDAEANVKVVQWNILALASPAADYGGFVAVPPEDLEAGRRLARVLETLQLHDPDIICLQGVDCLADLGPALEAEGYDIWFEAETESMCLKFGKVPYGCLVAVRRDKYTVETTKKVSFREHNHNDVPGKRLALVCTVREVASDFCFQVVSTHLKAGLGYECELERVNSIEQLQDSLEELPLILAGDMNSNPYSESWYRLIGLGEDAYQFAQQRLDDPRRYTTAKKRRNPKVSVDLVTEQRVSDYIMYSRMQRASHLLPPPISTLGEQLLPSAVHPSDHLPLVACFSFPAATAPKA